jgi:hypothetical protein
MQRKRHANATQSTTSAAPMRSRARARNAQVVNESQCAALTRQTNAGEIAWERG